jgi:hypothetical protein
MHGDGAAERALSTVGNWSTKPGDGHFKGTLQERKNSDIQHTPRYQNEYLTLAVGYILVMFDAVGKYLYIRDSTSSPAEYCHSVSDQSYIVTQLGDLIRGGEPLAALELSKQENWVSSAELRGYGPSRTRGNLLAAGRGS